MAWVTAGTAKDARLLIDPSKMINTNAENVTIARWRGGSYTFSVYEYGDGYMEGVLRTGVSFIGAVPAGDTWNYPVIIQHIGSTINISNGTLIVSNSASLTAGIWEYNDSYVDFVSFTNLDAPEGYTVDISAGSGGSVSTAQLTSVDNTTGKTFTATPNAGYRIASITPSTGVTVTPAASGQTAATTFTVKATQAGSVLVAFEAVPATHNHNALFGGAGF